MIILHVAMLNVKECLRAKRAKKNYQGCTPFQNLPTALTLCHNEVRDITAEMIKEVCTNV